MLVKEKQYAPFEELQEDYCKQLRKFQSNELAAADIQEVEKIAKRHKARAKLGLCSKKCALTKKTWKTVNTKLSTQRGLEGLSSTLRSEQSAPTAERY